GDQERSWTAGAAAFSAFGALALGMAALGLYSVITYGVAQRRHELGVRVALGARATDITQLVVGESVRFALLGLAIGAGARCGARRSHNRAAGRMIQMREHQTFWQTLLLGAFVGAATACAGSHRAPGAAAHAYVPRARTVTITTVPLLVREEQRI